MCVRYGAIEMTVIIIIATTTTCPLDVSGYPSSWTPRVPGEHRGPAAARQRGVDKRVAPPDSVSKDDVRPCGPKANEGHRAISRLQETTVFLEKGREMTNVSHTNVGTVSKDTLGKLLRERERDGVERIWAFPSAHIPS